MPTYDHRQRAAWLTGLLLVAGAASAALGLFTDPGSGPGRIMGIAFGLFLFLAAWLFGSLRIRVGPEEVSARFGPGLFGRRIPLARVQGARAVRNRWWYGWGIRLTPRGWLFNISGLDPVEQTLEGGKRVRFGTDEPRVLVAAIDRALAVRGAVPEATASPDA